MSGLEALIQVAEFGTKLSVKLFFFYRELKGANESIQNLSSDVTITSAILRELGEGLKEGEHAKLCSKTAFDILKDVLNQCEEVLEQIRDMTKYSDSSAKTRLQQITESFRHVLLEPSVDPLKTNLKRLKSTMLLLLNVITYAGQVRSNNVPKMLQEQNDFIKTLLEEKQKSDATIMATTTPITINASSSPHVGHWGSRDLANCEPSDLDEYSFLMQKMLQEISSCKTRLEQNRHARIRSGVLNIHFREILQFQLDHGQSVIQRFDHSLFVEETAGGSSVEAPPMPNHTSVRSDSRSGLGEVDVNELARPKSPILDDSNENLFSDTPPTSFPKIPSVNDQTPWENSASEERLSPVRPDYCSTELELPTDTYEGDIILLGSMAPDNPEIAAAARDAPISPHSSPKIPPADFWMGPESTLKCIPAIMDTKSESPPSNAPKICMLSLKPIHCQSPTSNAPKALEPVHVKPSMVVGEYNCDRLGCTAPPFQIQYLLNNVHAPRRLHLCPVKGCPRSREGKGFNRKNEMMRHGLVHNCPGYMCPFCPDGKHKYPRPNNQHRHVRVHHVDRSKDDPILRQALAQRPMGSARGRNRRLNPNGAPGIVPAQTPVQSPPGQFSPSEGPGQDSNSSSRVKIEFFPRIPAEYSDASETSSPNTSNDQSLPSIHEALRGLSNFDPSPIGASSFLQRAEKIASPNQATMSHVSFWHPPPDKTLELVLEWTNLTREEILQS